MTGAEVLEVMRDHSKVATSGGGVVCVCGDAFDAPVLHTIHVAEQIAAAFDGREPVQPLPLRRCIPAREISEEHLLAKVRVPAPDDSDPKADHVVDGVLAGFRHDTDPMISTLMLWVDGVPRAEPHPVAGMTWVEVQR